MGCEQLAKTRASGESAFEVLHDPDRDLMVAHLFEVGPARAHLRKLLLVVEDFPQRRRGEQVEERLGDALGCLGILVVGMRLVGRYARLLAEEITVDGFYIDLGCPNPEDAPNRGVQVRVPAEHAQENALIGVKLVVGERSDCHIGVPERQLRHANAIVVLKRKVERAHLHGVRKDLTDIGARPQRVAIRRLGADEVTAVRCRLSRHLPSHA